MIVNEISYQVVCFLYLLVSSLFAVFAAISGIGMSFSFIIPVASSLYLFLPIHLITTTPDCSKMKWNYKEEKSG